MYARDDNDKMGKGLNQQIHLGVVLLGAQESYIWSTCTYIRQHMIVRSIAKFEGAEPPPPT